MNTRTSVDAQLDVLMNLHTGVVVHAPDTRILFANHRAAELLGLSEDQLLGKTAVDPAWHFVDADGRPLAIDDYPVNCVISTAEPLHETVIGINAPHREHTVWVVVSAFPELNLHGVLQQIVVNFHDITARRLAELELQRSRIFATAILDGIAANVCVMNATGIIIDVNQAWRDFYLENGGDSDYQHEGQNYLKCCVHAITSLDPDVAFASVFYSKFQELIAGKFDSFELEYPCHTMKTKRWFFVRVSRLKNLKPDCFVATHVDVTPLEMAQERLREALDFSKKMVESMQDGVAILDCDGLCIDVNPALIAMTGFSRTELIGRAAPFAYWPPEDHQKIHETFMATLREKKGSFDLTFMRKSGDRFPVSVNASAVFDDNRAVIYYIGTVKDMSEYKRMEVEIRKLAFYDPLTGLPNRRLMNDRLDMTLVSSRRTGRYGGLMMLDLDQFKPLNDRYGHDAGDELLVEAAARIKRCIREMDTVARFGGDEFVVIINELSVDRMESAENLKDISEKIRKAMALEFLLDLDDGGERRSIHYQCTASIGCVTFLGKMRDAGELLKDADRAMYRAKKMGKNRVYLNEYFHG